MWLSVLAVAAAALSKLAPVQFVKIAEWATKNTQGDYRWFDDRLILIEQLRAARAAPAEVPATCTSTVLDIETKTSRELVFPLGAWAREHAALFYGKKTSVTAVSGREMGSIQCDDLVHVDRESGDAWYQVSNWNGLLDPGYGHQRFLVKWPGGDVVKVADTITGRNIRGIRLVNGRWYFEELQKESAEGRYTIRLAAIDLAKGTRVDLWKQEHVRGGKWHVPVDASRLVYIDYSELSQGKLDPPARLFVIDPATGASFAVPAPVSAYGVAFLPDGRSILVGSNELGTIERLDLEKRTWQPLAKGLRGLQRIELAPSGKSVLVMQRGAVITRFQIDPWVALPPLKIASFLDGKARYSWDWSDFSPNGRRALLSWNKLEGTVDYLDMEKPGVSLFEIRD